MTAQRVLITAGAGGIGRAIAQAYVDTGAKVHIAEVDTDALGRVTAEPDSATGTAGDISKPADVARIIADVKNHLGGLDVRWGSPKPSPSNRASTESQPTRSTPAPSTGPASGT